VPESLLRNTEELLPWFATSNEYVKSLKAKPSKKGWDLTGCKVQD